MDRNEPGPSGLLSVLLQHGALGGVLAPQVAPWVRSGHRRDRGAHGIIASPQATAAPRRIGAPVEQRTASKPVPGALGELSPRSTPLRDRRVRLRIGLRAQLRFAPAL